MKTYKTKKEATLFENLQDIYPDSSNSTIRKLLKNKRVYVNDVLVINQKKIIEKENLISIHPIVKKIPYDIELIFEDDDILIINKPKGLLSVPLDKGKMPNALVVLRKYFDTKNIFVVHRIDKATSGIMMFVKTSKAIRKFHDMFKKHDLKREYLAVVNGYVKEDKGKWESYLVEDEEYNVRSTQDPKEGKIAITHFLVIRRSKIFTYLKLTLETGRKHQIRVHCKDAGFPILGDKRYAKLIKNPISRMCLHSYHLEFLHPFTNKNVSFFAPVPKAFKKLGLYV